MPLKQGPVESFLKKLQQDTAEFFRLVSHREQTRTYQAELTVLHNQIFQELQRRLGNLDWADGEAVAKALRPYQSGLTRERVKYLAITSHTRNRFSAEAWNLFVKQVQTELSALRDRMMVEVQHGQEELAAGQAIAAECRRADTIEAVVNDLEAWPIETISGVAAKNRLLRALRALTAQKSVQALGALRLMVLEAVKQEALVAKLRGDLQTAENMLEEASCRPISPLPPVPDHQDEVEIEEDETVALTNVIEERIGDLEAAIDLVNDDLSKAERSSRVLAFWITEAERLLAEKTAMRRLLTPPKERPKIDVWIKTVQDRIEAAQAHQMEVEKIIDPRSRYKQRLLAELNALRTVLKCLDSEVDLHDSTSLPDWEEPDLETLFSEEKPVSDSKPVPVEAKAESATIPGDKIEGLPFPVSFDKAAIQKVRKFEAWLATFEGQNETTVKSRLPFTPSTTQENYYTWLVKGLQQGTFLSALKMGAVVLNAARRNRQPIPRLTKTVLNLMISRAVRLSIFGGSESTNAGRALGSVFVLGFIESRWRILNRVGTGNKYGRGNELTDLGHVFASVWTADLLTSGRVSCDQIAAIVQKAEEMDKWVIDRKKPKKSELT